MNHTFQFKYFSVKQEKSSMKIGTDGTLLGTWCNVSDKYRVLDIGTGTGLIALMVAQRNSLANIDAIEIEQNAYSEANENFLASPWKERLHCINKPLQNFSPPHLYDLIVTNPPFFNDSLKNKDENKTMARHTSSMNYEDILIFSSKNLYEEGILSLILPTNEAFIFEKEALKHGLYLVRRTSVFSNLESTSPIRVLMEFSRKKMESIKETLLTIETTKRHEYSEEYIELTKDFFLKF